MLQPDLLDQLRPALARRYVLEQELGRGGMATVYRALDRRHNRPVAVKIFPPELAAAIGPERFRREIAITSRLVHPHILALHDSGEAAGTLYYVMPLVEGESLRQRLNREPGGLPIEEVVSIARQIADALGYAHRLGVVHRDVTPENILLADGHALLADFGIARLLEGEPLTDAGTPLGTAMYRSPEQAAGHRDIDGRSDIYSLGCVLYQALAGGEADTHLSNRFARPVPPIGALRPNLPPSVGAAVARAMMADPRERFASAQEFSRALVTPAPAAATSRLPRALAMGALLALAGATALFAVFRLRGPALDPKRVMVGQFENRTGDRSLDVLGDIAGDYVTRGLAETQLVEVVDARAEFGDTGGSPATGRKQARTAGAAIMIRGSFYREGDSLHFETQILDTRSGKLIIAIAPAAGTSAGRMDIVEKVRQRLMAGFAALLGPGFESWQAQSIPPTFDAYREVLAGNQAMWALDNDGAISHYQRAARMDSTYWSARSRIVLAAGLNGDCRLADSVARSLAAVVARLPAEDRGQLEWGSAQCRGNWQAALEAGRTVMKAAPRSVSFAVLLSVTALELFRPLEALDVLRDSERRGVTLTEVERGFYWDWTALAYHELNDPAAELKTARAGLRVLPEDSDLRIHELLALGAMGKQDEMRRRRQAWFERRDLFADTFVTPGQVDLCLGLDLRAHGHATEARALIADAAEWYRPRSFESQSSPIPIPCTARMFSPAYYLDHSEEAQTVYRRLLATDSTSQLAHEALGALAARRGDRAEALRAERWLNTHPAKENGRTAYASARLFALLGETNRAIALLRQAFDEGLNMRMWVHVDPDFDPLRGMAAYRQLLSPTG